MTASTNSKLNKIEKAKAEKAGLAVKEELEHFAEIGWEAVDKTDLEMRLKWLGIFYRPVTPGKFMLRLRIPNGVMTSKQMGVLAEIVQRYGDDGSADITTRQNLQLRGRSPRRYARYFSSIEISRSDQYSVWHGQCEKFNGFSCGRH